jgi:hypothetical protein
MVAARGMGRSTPLSGRSAERRLVPAVKPRLRGQRRSQRGDAMDETLGLLAVILAAAVGVIATLGILRKQRTAAVGPLESPFAASTEGEKRCPKCGMGNLWMQATCISCGAKLPG